MARTARSALAALVVASAVLGGPRVLRGDEGRGLPAPRPVTFEVGSSGARIEVVHDARAGTVTVTGIQPVDRAVVFDAVPVLVLATEWGPREVPLTLESGRVAVWSATRREWLRREDFAGTVRLRVDGKRH